MKQVTVAYNKDRSPVKLNLGVGAYRTEVRSYFLYTISSILCMKESVQILCGESLSEIWFYNWYMTGRKTSCSQCSEEGRANACE